MSASPSTVTPSSTPTPTPPANGINTGGNSLSTATYYGAVAVVVFVLLIITCISRIMFRRRAARLASHRREQYRMREEEERHGMARRGEEAGLPTYRQSAFELMSSASAFQPITSPPQAHVASNPDNTVAPPPYRPPPPKYDDDDDVVAGGREGQTSTELGRGGQAVDAADVEMLEMSPTQQTTAAAEGNDEDAAAYERRTRVRDGSGRPDMSEPTVRTTLEPSQPPTHDAPLPSPTEATTPSSRLPFMSRFGLGRTTGTNPV